MNKDMWIAQPRDAIYLNEAKLTMQGWFLIKGAIFLRMKRRLLSVKSWMMGYRRWEYLLMNRRIILYLW